MKELLFATLEPLALLRAGKLSRELDAGRRHQVQRLHRASEERRLAARELRRPKSLPAALSLLVDALALSISALLTARGKLSGNGALARGDCLEALEALASEGVEVRFSKAFASAVSSTDPSTFDRAPLEDLERWRDEGEALLAVLRAEYEPRTPTRLSVARVSRLAFTIGVLALATVAFMVVTHPP